MSKTQSNLKLLANDEKKMFFFSAYLQDAIIIAQDIKFLSKNKTFACIFNRFMWEDAEQGVFRDNRRIRSALIFKNVFNVKSKNINVKKNSTILNFITETKLTDWEEYYFRGNEKYDSEDYEGAIEDFSESWTTKHKPKHKI